MRLWQKLTVWHPGNTRIVNKQVEGQVFLLEGNGKVFGGLEGGQIKLHVLHGELLLWMLLVYFLLHTLDSLWYDGG